MAGKSSIEWTDATWNPLRGCSRVSDGCRNCYAEGQAMRFSGPGQAYEGLVRMVNGRPTWTGKVTLHPDMLLDPIRWQRPHRIFVNSMSDLFHESVPFEYIAKVFAVMACTTRHTYQVLTKRPERMVAFFKWLDDYNIERYFNPPSWNDDGKYHNWPEAISSVDVYPQWKTWRENGRGGGYDNCGPSWPLTNVWLGVSVEDEPTARARIPLLQRVPAAVRWISFEPLLESIVASAYLCMRDPDGSPSIKWAVVGGESGRDARPMHPEWARAIREQCREAGVAFFFKQWGRWWPHCAWPKERVGDLEIPDAGGRSWMVLCRDGSLDVPDGYWPEEECGLYAVASVGKKQAGRMLDGRTWDEYPDA